jgi:hypothetical protein
MTMQTQIDLGAQARALPFLSHAARAIRQSRILIAIMLIHMIAALSIAAWYQVPFTSGTASRLLTMLSTIIPTFLIFLMFWRFGYMALFVRPQSPTRWFLNDMRNFCLDPERLVIGVVAFLTVSMFTGGFSFVKDMLPQLNPYSWDPALAQLDRWLHGGTDPYILLAPLLDAPLVTTWLNVFYHFWFFLLYFMTFVSCFDRDNPVRRNTFLISFMLSWGVGGNLLAILFASGGPVYYQVFGHGDAFVPLMDKLHDIATVSPVWALNVQDMLLDGYLNDGPIKGISAMPSMHLAGSTLMMCQAFTWRRWAGWLMVPFTFVILLGSVQLGWHYAVDGYLGILCGLASWYAARALARKAGAD